MLEKIKTGDRDPPLWMFISLCVSTIAIIYVLKPYLLDGNESAWGWYLVGIACVFMVIVLLRQRYIENKWSTYILQLVSIFLFLLGMGVIRGFREYLNIYIYAIIFISIFTSMKNHFPRRIHHLCY
jgi:cell division protein FtsW (lipid II flippase)